MRANDWADTPLGPPETWPQSLRTVVRILLTSRYQMWMGWGDGSVVLLQRRLPPDARRQACLGAGRAGPRGLEGNLARHRPAHRTRAAAPARRPGTKACCCSWSAAAIPRRPTTPSPTRRWPTTAATIVGMLCVVTEETERIIGERRLSSLRELASDIAGKNTPRRGARRLRRADSAATIRGPAVHSDLSVRRRMAGATAGRRHRHRRRPSDRARRHRSGDRRRGLAGRARSRANRAASLVDDLARPLRATFRPAAGTSRRARR